MIWARLSFGCLILSLQRAPPTYLKNSPKQSQTWAGASVSRNINWLDFEVLSLGQLFHEGGKGAEWLETVGWTQSSSADRTRLTCPMMCSKGWTHSLFPRQDSSSSTPKPERK
ncbi:hypothetical protein RSAG8_09435, partial [Rhizoctonia solani AG-8 WAC10335]